MSTQYSNQASFDNVYSLIWLISDTLWVKTNCPGTSDCYPVTNNPAKWYFYDLWLVPGDRYLVLRCQVFDCLAVVLTSDWCDRWLVDRWFVDRLYWESIALIKTLFRWMTSVTTDRCDWWLLIVDLSLEPDSLAPMTSDRFTCIYLSNDRLNDGPVMISCSVGGWLVAGWPVDLYFLGYLKYPWRCHLDGPYPWQLGLVGSSSHPKL